MNRVAKYLKFHHSPAGWRWGHWTCTHWRLCWSVNLFHKLLPIFWSHFFCQLMYFILYTLLARIKISYCVVVCALLQTQTITIAYCNGGDTNNNMSIVRCCNNTNFCNRDIQLKLPMEREGFHNRHGRPRPSPLVRPRPTSSTSTWGESRPGRLGARNSVHWRLLVRL